MNRADTRVAATRQAEKVLTRLLRTPKTREGLVAAVTSRMISRRFVFGWLTEQTRNGNVVVLKSSGRVAYQLKGFEIREPTATSAYPSWLDPRALPPVIDRTLFLDGLVVKPTRALNQPRKRRKRKLK